MKYTIYICAIALLMLCLLACSNRPLYYTFLIPANYTGMLRVVFDEKCGVKPRVENGRQILEFPNDGVLILNTEVFDGGMTEKNTRLNNEEETKTFLAKMKSEYYLLDNKGNKTKIIQISKSGEQLHNEPSILPGETTVSGYTYHNSEVEVKGITYQDFLLYNPGTTGTKEAVSSQQIEAATKALVNACRTGKYVQAQDSDWNHIGMEDVISKDSVTQNGYTLIFINKQPHFDSTVKQKLIETFFTVYPEEAKRYNQNTLRKVIFVIDPAYDGVAATADSIVRFNPEWFAKHPKDIDVVTHEVMHIVQSYHSDNTPGWLTEGIADYVRATLGVDNAGAGWALPAYSPKQNYTDAYRVTARFLIWSEKKYDKKLVQQLDEASRAGTYQPELWKKLTGKTVDELWKVYAGNPAI